MKLDVCRCVDEEDKSFAIGLAYLFVSLFAFIPSPIVYGAIIGQSCHIYIYIYIYARQNHN